MSVIQQQGVDLKEHFDRIEELKEEIHKRDMQIIEERFNRSCGIKTSIYIQCILLLWYRGVAFRFNRWSGVVKLDVMQVSTGAT